MRNYYTTGRRRNYVKKKKTRNFSLCLLCGLVGYGIGAKYPEFFYKVQNFVRAKVGNKKIPDFELKKKFLPDVKKDESSVLQKGNEIENKNFVQPKSVSIGENNFQVRFSPNGGCLNFAKSFIDGAQKYILVQGYSFTSELLAKALVEAHQRGVKVMILLDKSQPTAVGSQIYFVKNNGIPVAIDYVSGIAHNKIMIIDDKIVLTGSFNWTMNAETRNAENLLMINNVEVAKIYKENWLSRSKNSIKFLEGSKAAYEKNEKFYKKGKLPARQGEYTTVE
ncbi:MAG: phospholipase D family protein [Cytophagales bacterium]|jgi:phospholipase D|nr:phospholipase D family protein [Cytophagales bacterium]